MAAISQTIFSFAFSWMKSFAFWLSIGLDKGLALASNRRQAIIWTNADPIHWRIYATPEGWVKKMKLSIHRLPFFASVLTGITCNTSSRRLGDVIGCDIDILVIINSGNSLSLFSANPLPASMLTLAGWTNIHYYQYWITNTGYSVLLLLITRTSFSGLSW